ncbi:hypothetical protein RCH06_002865 [Polaromonas sp. CG_9.5]|uniref:hypothetical protein n=1 Tax=Polaromonas sp. CG_9.5 TaxID=3071705 RepID=UPI002E0484FA|nr:hypothetical protein [Polaromonas sp. CG_9.5]
MRFALTLVASSVILAACGGGSDNNSPSNDAGPSAPVAVQATLTSANYLAVAQETLSSSAYLATAADLATGAQVSDSDVLIRFGQDQLPKLTRWFSNSLVQAVGAVQTQTEACAGGGSLTITETDMNGNRKVDAGDSATLTAANCVFEGQSLNGQLALTVNSITGEPGEFPYSLSVSLLFTELAAKSSTVRSVGNGNLVLALSARAVNDQSLGFSTSSFAVAATYNNASYSRALTNYKTSVVVRPGGTGATSTSTVSGTLSSTAFESKSIDITTPVSFVRAGTQAYPASGQFIITGAAGSKVRITATSATMLTIELDADGNGSYELSTNKRWNEML